MVTEYNTKLIEWFKKYNIGPKNAVGFFAIPRNLEERNLKGELADLVEAKFIESDSIGRFYLYQGRAVIGTDPKAVIEYRKHDHLMGDIYNEISKRSKYKPIVSKDLERCFDISGSEVRDIVRVLRRKGEPIVGSNTGYFLASGTGEIQELIADLVSRISSMSETVKAIKDKAYDKYGTQLTLEL